MADPTAPSAHGGICHASEHPLVRHKVSQLRSQDLPPREYAHLVREVSTLVLCEATRDLPLEGDRLAARVGIIPVLRGGLGMAESAMDLLPTAQVWHLGIYRDKSTCLPVEYYNKLPKEVAIDCAYVLDPMPISGATALAAVDIIKAWGARADHPFTVKLVSLVATRAALDHLHQWHPDVAVHVGVVDNSAVTPLMPSLGDVGDRLFNTGARAGAGGGGDTAAKSPLS